MNAHQRQIAADFAPYRVITKIFGSLLGPEFIISIDGKTYRIGALTVAQLKSGVPVRDLEMLEVDSETYEAL